MIKTYNPREMKKWMEYSSMLTGIFFIILGLIKMDGTLCVLGAFFIIVVSNKTNIIIDQKGLLITTNTLYLLKREKRLNFKEMDSVSINKGSDKTLVYFMKGWKGRKILINVVDLNKLVDYIKSENPDLIKEE
ncbi:MAG: hypothetical protein U9N08_07515 [Candidatus Caldatribacteriota bacterium]|nr:hypothetical protein [Candidatus Caldatribacteriota bacterium]